MFAPLFTVQPVYEVDQAPALQDEALTASMAEIDSLDQGPDPGGLIWIECTGTWSAFTESTLAADEWIYYAAWSDNSNWIYDVWAPSPELRSAAIEALAAGAGGLE